MLAIQSESLNWPGPFSRSNCQILPISSAHIDQLHNAGSLMMADDQVSDDAHQWSSYPQQNYHANQAPYYPPGTTYQTLPSTTTTSYHAPQTCPTTAEWSDGMQTTAHWALPERCYDSQAYTSHGPHMSMYSPPVSYLDPNPPYPSHSSHSSNQSTPYPQHPRVSFASHNTYPVAASPSAGSTTSADETQSYSQSSGKSKTTKSYRCDFPGCSSSTLFTRHADLLRHKSSVHERSKLFPCDQPGCNRVGDKSFTRKDHLVEHQRSYHGLEIAKRQHGYQIP